MIGDQTHPTSSARADIPGLEDEDVLDALGGELARAEGA